MQTNELLARVHEGDEEAFRTLFAQHGESLYRSLHDQCHDKKLARETLKGTFHKAQAKLLNTPQPDATALWLNELAMNSLKELLAVSQMPEAPCEETQREQEFNEPEIVKGKPNEAEQMLCDVRKGMHEIPVRKEHHVATTIIAIVLIVLLLLTIWYIIGTLMKMGKLPQVDLGYSWFSKTIFPLF